MNADRSEGPSDIALPLIGRIPIALDGNLVRASVPDSTTRFAPPLPADVAKTAVSSAVR